MQDVVNRLRSRPKEERHAFAVMTAFAGAGLVGLVWLGSLLNSNALAVTPVETQTAGAANAELMRQKQEQLDGIKAQYGLQGNTGSTNSFPSAFSDDIPVVDVVPPEEL